MSLQVVRKKNTKKAKIKKAALTGGVVAALVIGIYAASQMIIPAEAEEMNLADNTETVFAIEETTTPLAAEIDKVLDEDAATEEVKASVIMNEKEEVEEVEEEFQNISGAHDFANFENLIREIAENTADTK